MLMRRDKVGKEILEISDPANLPTLQSNRFKIKQAFDLRGLLLTANHDM
jgi:hypothetical protein